MTLIGIHVTPDYAEIVTDSLAYTSHARRLGRSSKVQLLPQLEAAVVTQGDLRFGADAKTLLMTEGIHLATVDDVLATMPETFQRGWSLLELDQTRSPLTPSIVFVVGYSPTHGRFGAWQLASEHAFAPLELEGVFLHPSPVRYRPSHLELDRALRFQHIDQAEADTWASSPAVPAPEDGEAWMRLAVIARQERALDLNPHLKVLVGGRVFQTYLSRSGAAVTPLFEFNDSGEEFQRMVAGTLHPQGQAGPCPCGSNQRLIDCHLVPLLDEPCPCGTGETPLRACCAVLDLTDCSSPTDTPVGVRIHSEIGLR